MVKNKIYFLLLIVIFTNEQLYSQNVSINADGSNPDPSALLDVKAINKGVLLPRVALVSANNITSPLIANEGVVVWNTNTSGTYPNNVYPGFYTLSPTSSLWGRMESDYLSWQLNGNIISTSNVFGSLTNGGSLNSEYINFKINNISSGQINSNNTSFGFRSLQNNSTGLYNVAFGKNALQSNLSGMRNIAIGEDALLSCNSGSENVAIGFQSLYNSTKHWNTAVGSKSLYNSVNGYGNTAIGTSALYSDISGSYNAVFGFESMKNSTGTLFNVAIGVESLKANLGDRNCAIGNYALKNNSDVSAIKNTAIGFESLNSTVVGANNTAVGYNSLFNLINGNGNLALGNMSGFNLTSGNNLILIGANVGALFGTINGQMNVGNWIYGCNGKIGIGVISQPIVTFEINGNDALKIPVGSTAERPIAPIVGMIRFNNTISKFEAYDGSIWQQL